MMFRIVYATRPLRKFQSSRKSKYIGMTQDDNNQLDKAIATLQALSQQSSAEQRTPETRESFNDILLTQASDTIRNVIETFEIQYSQEAGRGRIVEANGNPMPSEVALAHVLDTLRQMSELVRDEETDLVLSRLRDCTNVVPEAEINQVRRQRDWFVPRLLKHCLDEIEKLESTGNEDQHASRNFESSTPFLSLFLFSELEVIESVPVILRALKLPGEGPFKLFGDAIHDVAHRYVAQFLADDFDQIDDLIYDSKVNLYVRWNVANAYNLLVRDGKLSIEAAVSRLDNLFQNVKVKGETGRPEMGHPYELSAGIVDVILSIGGAPISTIGQNEHDWKFVDESVVTHEEFIKAVANPGGHDLDRLPPTRIEDCIAELRQWGAFARSTPAYNVTAAQPAKRPIPVPQKAAISKLPVAEAMPVQKNDRPRRNDLCTCGSGKKYKQCCMRKLG